MRNPQEPNAAGEIDIKSQCSCCTCLSNFVRSEPSRIAETARNFPRNAKDSLKNLAFVLAFYASKVTQIPGAVVGLGQANLDGSYDQNQRNLTEVQGYLSQNSWTNYNIAQTTRDGDIYTDAQKELMNQELIANIEKIKKQEDELRELDKQKIGDVINSARADVNQLEKENSSAIAGRIITAFVLPGVFDILEIFSVALEHFNMDFVTGMKDVLSDEKVVGPAGKVVDALKIDEIFGFFADKTPVLSDFNKSFVQLANSELMSPFTNTFGSFIESQTADYMLRIAFFTHRIGQEIELNNKYKDQDERIRDTVEDLYSHIGKKNNEIIEKMAPRIIELETSGKLKNIYYQAFLKDSAPLESIFADKLLDSKIYDKNGVEAGNVKEFLEKIKSGHDSDDFKDLARNPQNRDIMKDILNTIREKYQNNENLKSEKIEMLKGFFDGDDSSKTFQLSKVIESEQFKKFMANDKSTLESLSKGGDLFENIAKRDGVEAEAIMTAIAKTMNLERKILDMKTTIPQTGQSWTERVSKGRGIDGKGGGGIGDSVHNAPTPTPSMIL